MQGEVTGLASSSSTASGSENGRQPWLSQWLFSCAMPGSCWIAG